MIGVALDDAPVGEHDPGCEQAVTGQPVAAPEDPEPSAERQPGDADRRARSSRDRHVVVEQRFVDGSETCAGTDRGSPVGDADVVHRSEVDEHPGGRRPTRVAVAATAHCDMQTVAAGEVDGGGDVLCAGAPRDDLRHQIVVSGDERSARGFEIG